MRLSVPPLLGLLLMGAVSFGPAGDFAASSFALHEGAHLAILFVAGPLLTLGLRALPPPLLGRAGALLAPLPAFGLYTLAVAAAHLPPLDRWALASAPGHLALHATLLVASGAFWAQVWGPQTRLGYPLRMAVLLVATGLHALIGGVVAFSEHPLYAGYPAASTVDRLADQALGGVLFWIPPKLLFIGVITALFFRWLEREERSDASAA